MLKNRAIQSTSTLIEALKRMDQIDRKLLVILDNNKFLGLISAGDIQRSIIQNIPLTSKVSEVMRKNIRYARPEDSFEMVKKMMFEYRMELCPVVDENNVIQEIYFWEDVFQGERPRPQGVIKLPVVIMAGGFGTRLKPLTNVLPKPLIPIKEKTMLEEIFERFNFHGCNKFYVSLNYKADLVEYYIRKQNLPYEIEFLREESPNGTAGSISLLKGKLQSTFFVTNCDILIDQDYSEILQYHKSMSNEITVVTALKQISIPYGTVETGIDGQLIDLVEKPELTFKINCGMYILEPSIIDEIPQNTMMDITTLIQTVKHRGGNVGIFPINSRSWTDVGSWSSISRYYYLNDD